MVKGVAHTQAVRSINKPDSDYSITHEVDPDFQEHLNRKDIMQPELPLEH